ncbi:aldehyde dehydrogenase family protein, partial [Streptomyces sp. SID2119]|nr:aldehyde dehydrogenase family protein [Streptomyces sp. SID2119]
MSQHPAASALDILNPATAEVIATVPAASADDVDAAVHRAAAAQR